MPTEPVEVGDVPVGVSGRWGAIRILAVGLWVGTEVLVVAAAITSFLDPTPDSPGSPDALFVPLIVALVTSLATVGALLGIRRASNPIGWLMLTSGFLIAISVALFSFQQYATATGRGLETPLPDWLTGAAFQAGLVLQVLVVLVFPDGVLARKSRAVAAALLVGLTLSTVGDAIEAPGSDTQGPVEALGNIIIIAGVLLAAMGIVRRLRAAEGDERKQLEWFAWVAAVLAVALVVAALQLGFVSDAAWAVAFAAFTALPIAIAVAVMKYRLYEIDSLVSRTLVYAPLIGILGGIFAAGTFLLQRIFVAYTGDTSDAAVVMATLIVAGTFTPVRKALEAGVERRFSTAAVRSRAGAPGATGGPPPGRPPDDMAFLLDDPRLTARIEEIARRISDERVPR